MKYAPLPQSLRSLFEHISPYYFLILLLALIPLFLGLAPNKEISSDPKPPQSVASTPEPSPQHPYLLVSGFINPTLIQIPPPSPPVDTGYEGDTESESPASTSSEPSHTEPLAQELADLTQQESFIPVAIDFLHTESTQVVRFPGYISEDRQTAYLPRDQFPDESNDEWPSMEDIERMDHFTLTYTLLTDPPTLPNGEFPSIPEDTTSCSLYESQYTGMSADGKHLMFSLAEVANESI